MQGLVFAFQVLDQDSRRRIPWDVDVAVAVVAAADEVAAVVVCVWEVAVGVDESCGLVCDDESEQEE